MRETKIKEEIPLSIVTHLYSNVTAKLRQTGNFQNAINLLRGTKIAADREVDVWVDQVKGSYNKDRAKVELNSNK